MSIKAYGAASPKSQIEPMTIERRKPRPNDVVMKILYCGVCHSDLHSARNDWGGTIYPLVPGHEIVGEVTYAGPEVKKFKVGDKVAVGCMVDSCLSCDQCHNGKEQYCREGMTGTYNGRDRLTQDPTHGGYSTELVVREDFLLSLPDNLDISKAAPLLCAGITTYSPLRTWNVGPGSRVGIIGLGGLGHMAVKFASALGAHVTVMSRTPDKKKDIEELGADAMLVSTDASQMEKAKNSFDLIIDTVPVHHDLNPYIPLLDVDGTLAIVGQVGPLSEPNTVPLIMGRRRIAGSVIGGIKETQEMLDFAGRHNILPDVEMIRMDEINEAYERMIRSDVRYRFVIDMASLK